MPVYINNLINATRVNSMQLALMLMLIDAQIRFNQGLFCWSVLSEFLQSFLLAR